MERRRLAIRGRQVVIEQGVRPASVRIRDGRIESIGAFEDDLSDCNVVDVPDQSLVMPGLVDTHVHVNEPGRTDWEGFESATRAAAAGGVTTIIDMPLNSIPATTTAEALKAKVQATRGKLYVDVGFWGGVVPGNAEQLQKIWAGGAVGFKCFLIHSGVDEFPNVTERDLREAMPQLARLGATLIVHAEMPGPVMTAGSQVAATASARCYETFLRSRPRAAEDTAIELMIELCRETGCRIHIVHHSSADALPLLRRARSEGLPLTVETCPHYLHFAAEDVPDGSTEFKCCPPIRERENREQLWEALREGLIDMVVSDHSPCPPEMKLSTQGDFMKAWGGISSLQLRLPVMWTEGGARGFNIEQMVAWLCSAPARLVGMQSRKGTIAPGCDADFVIWNPNRSIKVEPSMIEHRHKLTPYAGEVLRGAVEKTFVRGEIVYDDGTFSMPKGSLLLSSNI